MSADADKAGKAGKERTRKKRGGDAQRRIDAKYVGRARSLFNMIRGLAKIYDDRAELAAMNRGKRGRPYVYTHSLVAAISSIRDSLGLDFRGCEGLLPEGKGPEYTTIFRRVNAQDASIRESLSGVECSGVAISLVPDGTGLTPATRSEYVRVVHRLRRGFLRLTIMINKETLEIVAFRLTDDSVGEPTVFEDLLHDALANLGVDPDRRRAEVLAQKNSPRKTYRGITLMADGGYDSGEIFSACRKLGIATNIRVRVDANARADGVDRAGSEAVLDQLGGGPGATAAGLAALDDSEREANRRKWKERVRYGTRWLVEIVISAFKRTYGDAVAARKMENIRQEIRLKICTYNRMLRIGREAAMKA
ncbi:MAG: transposase [Thaumarchaeota archaeon]|nr:transposase [Nitrososphaerota archaeon]MDE0527007.1 transposase [Nitrososphaerota archaeon]